MNIHRVAHQQPCAAAVDLESHDAPAAISMAAMERTCQDAWALDVFVEAYGAEAGNLALRLVSTGGAVGGGIAPKIPPALTTGAFMRAFGRNRRSIDAVRDAGESDPERRVGCWEPLSSRPANELPHRT